MKKYIAIASHIEIKSSNGQTSGFKTVSDATQWARNQVQKNPNLKAYVCEVLSEVARPEPVVIVQPFVPEPEKAPEDK